jgi:hypothetical protein
MNKHWDETVSLLHPNDGHNAKKRVWVYNEKRKAVLQKSYPALGEGKEQL